MITKIWQWLQLLLPYGLILWINKTNKALPANIRTRHGQCLKAIMITPNYGILFTAENYISNRVKYLKEQQATLNSLTKALVDELNSLSFESRELFSEE